MENFSTPRRALVPVAANLLTLLALVCTTWWSSNHRQAPQAQPSAVMAGKQTSTATPATAAPVMLRAQDDVVEPQATTQATLSSAALDREGLRNVGYHANSRR